MAIVQRKQALPVAPTGKKKLWFWIIESDYPISFLTLNHTSEKWYWLTQSFTFTNEEKSSIRRSIRHTTVFSCRFSMPNFAPVQKKFFLSCFKFLASNQSSVIYSRMESFEGSLLIVRRSLFVFCFHIHELFDDPTWQIIQRCKVLRLWILFPLSLPVRWVRKDVFNITLGFEISLSKNILKLYEIQSSTKTDRRLSLHQFSEHKTVALI